MFAGKAADGTAEDVDVAFLIGSFEEARDEIPLLGDRFFAYRTYSLDGNFLIGMTMRTAEDVADTLLVSGEEGGLDLRPVGQKRGAQGTDPVFSDLAPGYGCFFAVFPVSRSGKEAVGENQQQKAREHQKENIKRCWNHILT